MVCIDTNMIRAGVVSHPSQWSFCAHNEIQEPRRNNILIDYEKLQLLLEKVKALLGFKAKGRNDIEGGEGYHLREKAAPYTARFGSNVPTSMHLLFRQGSLI
jgi:hypothetical protein